MTFTMLVGGIAAYTTKYLSPEVDAELALPHAFSMMGVMAFALLVSIVYAICLRFRLKSSALFKTTTLIGLGCYTLITVICVMKDVGITQSMLFI